MKVRFVGMEKLSLLDFDNRLVCTLFTGGCNFRCPFCHNKSLVIGGNWEYLDFDDILAYLAKRKNVLDAVCITGGEPTLMPWLEEALVEIKKLGYIIKLDTNGTNLPLLKQLVAKHLVDYIAMDVKNALTEYTKTIDQTIDVEIIKDAIEYLKTDPIDYEFRTTIVAEFHDDTAIAALARLLTGAKRLYLQKFIDQGNCIASGLNAISKEKALEYKNLLEKHINFVALRGYDN